MIMNVVFLIGGIGIGYLIRGEMERKKSAKAMKDIFDAGFAVAKELLDSLGDEKKEAGEVVDDTPWTVETTNSTDETIQLDDIFKTEPEEK